MRRSRQIICQGPWSRGERNPGFTVVCLPYIEGANTSHHEDGVMRVIPSTGKIKGKIVSAWQDLGRKGLYALFGGSSTEYVGLICQYQAMFEHEQVFLLTVFMEHLILSHVSSVVIPSSHFRFLNYGNSNCVSAQVSSNSENEDKPEQCSETCLDQLLRKLSTSLLAVGGLVYEDGKIPFHSLLYTY